MEEGFGLPAEGVALTYLDRRRERSVTVLFSSLPAAEAWVAGGSEREGAAVLPLATLGMPAPAEEGPAR